MSFLYAAFSL